MKVSGDYTSWSVYRKSVIICDVTSEASPNKHTAAPGPSRPGRCCNTIVIIIYTLPGTLFSQFVCNIVSRDQIKLLTNLLYLINQSIFFTFRDCILWEISCLNFGSREGGEGRGERREERRERGASMWSLCVLARCSSRSVGLRGRAGISGSRRNVSEAPGGRRRCGS